LVFAVVRIIVLHLVLTLEFAGLGLSFRSSLKHGLKLVNEVVLLVGKARLLYGT
jgi:hypothetical protein